MTRVIQSEFDLIQDVAIVAVEEIDGEVRVDIVGPDGCIGSVLYHFGDERDAGRHASVLRTWSEEATPVTYVRREATVALVDERALLAAALD
jgi:hypothetical protein